MTPPSSFFQSSRVYASSRTLAKRPGCSAKSLSQFVSLLTVAHSIMEPGEPLGRCLARSALPAASWMALALIFVGEGKMQREREGKGLEEEEQF